MYVGWTTDESLVDALSDVHTVGQAWTLSVSG